MSKIYDLHTHSTASDGTLHPRELIQRAVEAGVYGLALTDHDTIAGLAEGQTAAIEAGIQWIPGVEISATWNNKTIHIVGLWINANCEVLQTGLTRLRKFRDWRAEEMGRRLAQHHIANAFEGASQLSNGQVVTRTHFARFLVQQGFASNEHQVFEHFLTCNKPGYVLSQWAEIEEAIYWITQANGLAVLAHPGRYKLNPKGLRQLIGIFKDAGGSALEVVSSSHSPENTLIIAKLANEFGLMSSAGSDFHDPHTSWMGLGKLPSLPHGCIPIWQHLS